MRTLRSLAILGILCLSTAAFGSVVGSGTPSSCTKEALAAAIPAGGTITFNCGAGPQTIAIASVLVFGQNTPPVTIDGGDTITLDGTGITSGMIWIFGSATALPDVTFRHITIANGNITTGLNAGGAIQNFGKLTLDTVTLSGNKSAGSGAIFQEPCTGCLTPSLTATHSLFQNNTPGSGTISIQGGIAAIEDSTFSGNSASGAAAIEVYSNATFKVDVAIDRCTFSGNSGSFAGAIAIELLNPGSAVAITNCTFTGNTVASGGHGSAIYVGASPVTITNCTIAGNSGPGAVYIDAGTSISNTILASNTGGNCAFGAGVTFTGSHDLQFGDSTCSGVPVADPHLGPLAGNGGATQTMALGAGSPAIDAGDGVVAPPTDQRGQPRMDGNHDGIAAPDIGAYEAPGPTAPQRRHLARH